MTVAEDGALGGPVAKNISGAKREGLVAGVGAEVDREDVEGLVGGEVPAAGVGESLAQG